LATVLAAAGFPSLLTALVLVATMPSRIYPSSVADEAGELAAIGDGTPEAAAAGTSSETLDLAGWELYLHSAEVGRPHLGVMPIGGILTVAKRVLESAHPTRMAAFLPARAQYQPQAPPV
jgi:hypothetical protein